MAGRPPPLSPTSVIQLIERHYDFENIVEGSLKQLPSYYDANFYFCGSLNKKYASQPQASASGQYMFKILNVRTSSEMANGLSALWCHLQDKGLDYTGPVRNEQGDMVTTLTTQELANAQDTRSQDAEIQQFSARVMRFVPGVPFDSVDKRYLTPKLLFEVGAFIAKIDTTLKDGFRNSAIESRNNLDWDLVHFPYLRSRLSGLEDSRKQAMVEKALSGFEECVLPQLSTFAKGIIYNDPSGQNIIVQKDDKADEYSVAGMIDFDETVCSCYIFDLAVALAYIMMENLSPIGHPSSIEFMAPLISGYASKFPLTVEESSCLFYLTLARCCQSAVSGELSFKEAPWNEYLLTTPRKSWKLIELLLNTGKDYVDRVWGDAVGKRLDDY